MFRTWGLNVIENNEKNKQFEDPHQPKGKYKNTFRYQIRNDIDYALKKAIHLDEFKEIMAEKYEIKEEKHLAFKHKTNGQERFIRCRSLGYRYQETMLQLRIDTEFLDMKNIEEGPVSESYIKRVINLEKNDKFKNNPGLQYWGISHNNLAISQTIYRLHQLGIGSFKQLENFMLQTTLTLENDKKEVVKLEKEGVYLLKIKELLPTLNFKNLEEEINEVIELDLTDRKPNKELEKITALLKNNTELSLISNRLETIYQITSSIDELYYNTLNDISKLKINTIKKNTSLDEFETILNNYNSFLKKERDYSHTFLPEHDR